MDSEMMLLDELDKYDIMDSFEALDEDKIGRISLDAFSVMYLGLGYPKQGYESLKDHVIKLQPDFEDGILLDTVLAILSRHPATNRQESVSKNFSLVDTDAKGYITADDIKKLSEDVGEDICKDEAEAYVAYSSVTGKLHCSSLQTIFTPPSP